MLTQQEYSVASDYYSSQDIPDISYSYDKSTLTNKSMELYSMSMNSDNWVEIKPPLEVGEDDFILRPKFMVENHPYRFIFQDEEVFTIKRSDGKITVFNLRKG